MSGLSEREVQDFAVTIAALLAGRIDGQQAVATTAAQADRIVAARVAAAEQRITEALAEAWNEGYHAGQTYQQEIQRHAHWSHIGKAMPDPILNPYRRAALARPSDEATP